MNILPLLDVPFELDVEAYEELGPTFTVEDLQAVEKVIRRNRFILEGLCGEVVQDPSGKRLFSFWSRVIFDPDNDFRFTRAHLKIKFNAGLSCVRRLYPEEVTEAIVASAWRKDGGFSIEAGRKDPSATFAFDYEPIISGTGVKLDEAWWKFKEKVGKGGIAARCPLYVLVECSEGAPLDASILVNAVIEREDGLKTFPLGVRRKLSDLVGKLDLSRLESKGDDGHGAGGWVRSKPRDRPEHDDGSYRPDWSADLLLRVETLPVSDVPATLSPVDLEIHVTTQVKGDALALDYVLHSPNGRFEPTYFRFPRGFLGHPDTWQRRIFSTLEKLHGGLDFRDARLTATEITKELALLGEHLSDKLLPPELLRTLQEVREAETVLLFSDEPWIPWEIVKPYEGREAQGEDDGFLGSRQLTRWLAGRRPPALIDIDRLAVVEAGSPPDLRPLTKATDELRFLRGLAARHRIDDQSVPDADYQGVLALLTEHDLGLIHFIGHGEHDPEFPESSGFHLHDGRTLRPLDLSHELQRRLEANRPLVFMNSCQMGRQGWSLTRPGGWARRFVLDAGCGAFVAPQWTVGDEVAHTFALAFYEALERGKTFGEATLAARGSLPKGSPGRLAYAVYAHPGARLAFPDRSADRPPSSELPRARRRASSDAGYAGDRRPRQGVEVADSGSRDLGKELSAPKRQIVDPPDAGLEGPTIDAPRNSEKVPRQCTVKVSFANRKAAVWVVVHPVGTGTYWVQPRASREASGIWNVNAVFGQAGDSRKEFEICAWALAAPTVGFQEGKVLRRWPDAKRSSGIVRVIRENNQAP